MSTSINSTTPSSSPNDKFIFKCDQHATSISEKLLKFYEEKDFFDTVLIAGNDCIKIPAHKIVLSALSEYFWEIFHGNPTNSQANEVKLKEIEAQSLKFIVDFMYSGWIELNFEIIETLLRSAVFLKIKNLINGCCDFLEKNLNIRNCLHWLRLAKEMRLTGLQEKSLKLVYTNFEEVTKKSEFLDLNKIELKDLLFKDNPYGHLEEQVFLSLVTWIEYEKVNRQDLLVEMLSMVRYQHLTPKFIIKNRTSVCKSLENCELVYGWLQYHLWPESRTIEQQNFISPSSESEPRKEVILQEEVGEVAAFYLNRQKEAEILSCNKKLEKWSIRKRSYPLLTKKTNSSMIVIDEQLFLVGGINGSGDTTNCVECIDLKTFKLTDFPPMQIGRYESQLVNLNGHLCVFGGFENSQQTKIIDSMEILNFSTRKWSNLKSPFKPEKKHQILSHNGILYIFDFRHGCVQCYDVSSNQWTSKKIPIDDSMEDFRMVAVGNLVYAIYTDIGNTMIKCFDLSNDTCFEEAELSGYESMVKMVTVIGNKFLIHKTNGDIVEYNLDTKKFIYLCTLSLNNVHILPFKM